MNRKPRHPVLSNQYAAAVAVGALVVLLFLAMLYDGVHG